MVGMNALDLYLSKREITNADFGRIVGASESTISRVRRGKQTPSLDLIRRFRDATNGALSANDFLSDATPTEAA